MVLSEPGCSGASADKFLWPGAPSTLRLLSLAPWCWSEGDGCCNACRSMQDRVTRNVTVPGVGDLESYMRRLGDVERRVFSAFLRRRPITKNPAETLEDLTLGQRVADKVAEFGGNWKFICLFAAFMLGWILLNTNDGPDWDPYPFILLNLLLSCLAALQAPVIMMSQNRLATKDRLAAQQDYEVNLKSEMEVMSLHAKLDEAREIHWKVLLDLQQSQMQILERLETRIHDLEELVSVHEFPRRWMDFVRRQRRMHRQTQNARAELIRMRTEAGPGVQQLDERLLPR